MRDSERDPTKYPLNDLMDEYEECEWRWSESWRDVLWVIKRHLGEGVPPTRAQILEVAAATDSSGRPIGRIPPFDMDSPDGYYQKCIVPRRARAMERARYEAAHDFRRKHMTPHAPSGDGDRRRNRAGKGEKGGDGLGDGKGDTGLAGGVTAGGPTEVCFDFQKGLCNRGDECRFAHPTDPPPGGDGRAGADGDHHL